MPTMAHVDTPTFEEYAAAAWPSLYRHAYLLSGNHADAEDLAQQTLIKAHGAWAKVARVEAPQTVTCAASWSTPSCLRSPSKGPPARGAGRGQHTGAAAHRSRVPRTGWRCGRRCVSFLRGSAR